MLDTIPEDKPNPKFNYSQLDLNSLEGLEDGEIYHAENGEWGVARYKDVYVLLLSKPFNHYVVEVDGLNYLLELIRGEQSKVRKVRVPEHPYDIY